MLSNPNFPSNKLKEQINKPHCRGKTPLVQAVSLSRPKAVKALLECGANPHEVYSGPSVLGGMGWHKNCPKYPNLKLVHYALLLGDVKSALALVRHGANAEGGMHRTGSEPRNDLVNYTTAMRYAIYLYNQDPQSCSELIQELFDRGYNEIKYTWNTNQHKTNPWVLAIEAPSYFSGGSELNEPLVDLFVKNGLDVNQSIPNANNCYDTPLGLAVSRGDVNAVRLLLERGADPNKTFQKGNQSFTPLKVAGRTKHSTSQKVIALLHEHGARN